MSETYTRGQKILHWLLAFLILFWLFVSGEIVESSDGEEKGFILMFHSGGAIAIFGLMLFRYSRRLKNPVTPMATLKTWEQTWSRRIHLSFYVLIGIMVLSGIAQGMFFDQDVRVFGLVNITLGHNEAVKNTFHIVHESAASLLKLFIAIHILAALKHQFVDKQSFVKRMT